MDGPKDPSQTGEDRARPQAELDRLAEDWITLWQSEIAGLAADREAAEAWAVVAQGMAQGMAAMGAAWMRAASTPPPFAWPAPFAPEFAPEPARPAPAAAPPDPGRQPGDGGAERDAGLAARLAELEGRLAAIEGGPGRKPADRRRPGRRKPPA